MLKLEPMLHEEFLTWRAMSVQEYADEKIKAGNATEQTALDVSQREFARHLPQGENSKGNFLRSIYDGNQPVGMVWLQERNQEMYIVDIRINSNKQGLGYGKATMMVVEDFSRDIGISKISLHVFGHNERAIRLYQTMNYKMTNIVMSKDL